MKRSVRSLILSMLILILPFTLGCGGENRDSEATPGLEFSLNQDGRAYSLCGIGSADEAKEIIVPSEYNGLPVIAVLHGTFPPIINMESVYFPDSIETIEGGAFSTLNYIKSVRLPSGIKYIDRGLFCLCASLENIEIPQGVTEIADSAFSGCSSLKDLEIPDSVKRIGVEAFNGCASITGIKIPYGVESIEIRSFHNCTSLKDVDIPQSVLSIQQGAFYGCVSLTDIYYKGTSSQWEAISKGNDWAPEKTTFTVHCSDRDIIIEN